MYIVTSKRVFWHFSSYIYLYIPVACFRISQLNVFFESVLHLIYIDHIHSPPPPSSSLCYPACLFPSFMHSVVVTYPLSPLSGAHMLMGVWPSTGSWASHKWPHPPEESSLSSCQPIVPPTEILGALPCPCWNFWLVDLLQVCSGSHSNCVYVWDSHVTSRSQHFIAVPWLFLPFLQSSLNLEWWEVDANNPSMYIAEHSVI